MRDHVTNQLTSTTKSDIVRAEDKEQFGKHPAGVGLSSKALVAKLKWNREWLQSLREGKRAPGDSDRAINLMVGCLQTIAQCDRRSVADWLERKPERGRTLKDIRNRFRSETGNRVLRQLVELAISEVEACTWVKKFWLGAFARTERARAHDSQTAGSPQGKHSPMELPMGGVEKQAGKGPKKAQRIGAV